MDNRNLCIHCGAMYDSQDTHDCTPENDKELGDFTIKPFIQSKASLGFPIGRYPLQICNRIFLPVPGMSFSFKPYAEARLQGFVTDIRYIVSSFYIKNENDSYAALFYLVKGGEAVPVFFNNKHYQFRVSFVWEEESVLSINMEYMPSEESLNSMSYKLSTCIRPDLWRAFQ